MPKITNKKQVEHGVADSKTHKEDKARNEARRSFTMIYMPVRTERMFGFRREFSRYLGNGEQFVVEPNKNYPKDGNPWNLVPKNGRDWIDEHERMRKARGWFWETRERQRKAGKILTEEPRKFDPFNDLFITLAPWVQAYLFIILKFTTSSGKKRVDKYLRDCLNGALSIVNTRTENEIPFAYLHYDTDDLHIGLRPCYIDAQNRRIGEPWMRTVGAAAVGYDRQVQMNAGSGEALRRLVKSKDIYAKRAKKERLPERTAKIPMDLELAQLVDRIAEERFGKDPAFIYAKECYYLYATKRQLLLHSKQTLENRIVELKERLATITDLEEKHAKALEQLGKTSEASLPEEDLDGDEPDNEKSRGDEMPM